jgi:hypothetical protein
MPFQLEHAEASISALNNQNVILNNPTPIHTSYFLLDAEMNDLTPGTHSRTP